MRYTADDTSLSRVSFDPCHSNLCFFITRAVLTIIPSVLIKLYDRYDSFIKYISKCQYLDTCLREKIADLSKSHIKRAMLLHCVIAANFHPAFAKIVTFLFHFLRSTYVSYRELP